ncbi:hypothetical protein VI06_06810 [Aquitalea magnusonii]|nr:hypothetical protein VI06_06810 [Aquitalea magnusonii]
MPTLVLITHNMLTTRQIIKNWIFTVKITHQLKDKTVNEKTFKLVRIFLIKSFASSTSEKSNN